MACQRNELQIAVTNGESVPDELHLLAHATLHCEDRGSRVVKFQPGSRRVSAVP